MEITLPGEKQIVTQNQFAGSSSFIPLILRHMDFLSLYDTVRENTSGQMYRFENVDYVLILLI